MDSSGTNRPKDHPGLAPPNAALLVREAHKAAEAVAGETIAFLGELHPELLDGLPPQFDDVLRLAVRHASLRWICGVSTWWAREARTGENDSDR